jgi:hypothetical protein
VHEIAQRTAPERAAEATATEVLRRPLPTATLGLLEQTLGGRTTTPQRGESTVQRTSGVAAAPILTATSAGGELEGECGFFERRRNWQVANPKRG